MITMKMFLVVIAALIGSMIILGVYTFSLSTQLDLADQKLLTKEVELNSTRKDVSFMKAWMARDKLDAIAKDAEFNRTMAAKPPFRTKIQYVPTGNNCVDLNAIIDEARGDKNAGGKQL